MLQVTETDSTSASRWHRRYSLRGMLLLVAGIAVLVAFYGNEWRIRVKLAFPDAHVEAAIQQLRRKDVRVYYESPSASNPRTSWEHVDAFMRGLTDTDMDAIGELPNLKCAILASNPITDDGVRQLARCRQLQTLNLTMTDVTDESVWQLAELPNLRSLHLDWTEVTDNSINALVSMPALREIYLDSTQITPAGIAMLKAKRSTLEIHFTEPMSSLFDARQRRQFRRDARHGALTPQSLIAE